MPPSPSSSTPKPKPKLSLPRLANYTVFTFLSIICLCLILLTPADAIYQCYITHRLTNIFIITGGYVVTFILAVLIYATRIYTNRSVLGGIPKAWIPVEKEDVGKSVRRLVVEGLGRSALIAGGARPRGLAGTASTSTSTRVHAQALVPGGSDDGEEREGLLRGFDYDIDPANPPWGVIEHPGWSAPESSLSASSGEDTQQQQQAQGLCYRTVIRELAHLIEAKAVSLAPPDPSFTPHQDNEGHLDYEGEEEAEPLRIPDTRIVAILRRPPTMSLRSYIAHLTSLSILNPPETGLEFLSLYERARFSGKDLYESEFRELMGVFADVLRGMRFDLDQQHLLDMDMDMDSRDKASFFTSRSESAIGPSDEEGETETDRETLDSFSRRRHRYAYQNQYPYPYASGTGANLDGAGAARSISSIRRPAQWHSPGLAPRTPSTHSLRPDRTNDSGASSTGSGSSASASASRSQRSGTGTDSDLGSGAGSVIRLADARAEQISGLPYNILGNQ
ncbi:uncharacterized protein BDV17DRAFT_255202 [Aspergillus undulatus]|uniref:uncharacterized protein n=1 Tax=Aspergillus undulatus TaxID=1810928 RepID=UPI003CCCB1B4